MSNLSCYNFTTGEWEELKVSTKFTELTNTVTLTQDSSYVNIGITNFNPIEDVLYVFKNSTFQAKGTKYILNGGLLRIETVDGSVWKKDTIFNFVALKNVDKNALPSADGSLIQDGSITISKLATSIQSYINKIGTGTLKTTAQDLSGGVNEIVDKIGILNNLGTIKKDNIVNSINEINAHLADIAVNVKSFGAKGDGIIDDYNAIVNAINIGSFILFPAGVYKIGKPFILKNLSNKTFIFQNGANVYWEHGTNETTANTGVEALFHLVNCKNIKINGGNFYTDGIRFYIDSRAVYSQWMHFFHCSSECENITIENCTGHDFPGDFFEIYGGKNIRITNCIFDRCWRTGISPVICENVWIENCTLTNASLCDNYTMPGCISFESDQASHYVKNFYIKNCILSSNTICMMLIPVSDTYENIHVESNVFTAPKWAYIGGISNNKDYSAFLIKNNIFNATTEWGLYQYPNKPVYNLKFDNCKFNLIGSSKMLYFTDLIDIEFNECTFFNSDGTIYSDYGIITTELNNLKKNIKFIKCNFIHKSLAPQSSQPLMRFQANVEFIECNFTETPNNYIKYYCDINNNKIGINKSNMAKIFITGIGSTVSNPQSINLEIHNAMLNTIYLDAECYFNILGILNNTVKPTATTSKHDDSQLVYVATPKISPKIGDYDFNKTLNKPVWWNGTNWVDSTGTIV